MNYGCGEWQPRGYDVVDAATLASMLANLRRYVVVLEGLAAVSKEAFLRNSDRIGNAKYHFVIAIECCIDIANHIVASENFRFPKDNADSFAVLIEERVLPEAFREATRNMARFRNRLVHLYWEVDDERVYDYLQTALGDFHSFARWVAEHPWKILG
jgi:uncharacterized protein YutE (UPF0331/DUF86 family)